MPLPNFITKIFSGGASELVDKVGGLVDNLTMSKEEKEQFKIDLLKAQNEHEAKMAALAQAELDAQLKDAQDARNREIQIAVSDKAPLINKIITPVLAVGIVVLTFILFYLIMFKGVKGVEKDILVFVLGALTGYVGMILSYYFGSSISSRQKSEQLDKLMNK